MGARAKPSRILRRYASLQDVMLDKDLAKLGDAYVNFAYSLALSQRLRRPTGAKVNNRGLAEAIKRAGLREMLPPRTDRHARGNAAEALIVYSWLRGILSLEDCLRPLKENENVGDAFTELLKEIGKKLGMVHG